VHKNHVDAVLKDSRFVETYGVKGESVFNDIANFSVSHCLPPDPMHDVLEGLCPTNIKIVLLGLISHGKVTVKIINERLDMFVFSKCDVSDKPPHIPTDFVRFSRLTGSASQNWCLFRNLPFILHDLLDFVRRCLTIGNFICLPAKFVRLFCSSCSKTLVIGFTVLHLHASVSPEKIL
jgi:hypothetical protein